MAFAFPAIHPEDADRGLPVLFKPMGSPRPQSSYIASDADHVDYITELIGGFAAPSFVKTMRRGMRSPPDAATGYSQGRVRGALTVKRPL